MTHLMKAVIEDKLSTDVELTQADVAPIFTGVADGDLDAFLDAWFPTTHKVYRERYGDRLDDYGINFAGAKIGLVVPTYVTVNAISELNDTADQFRNRIVGIDAGAGIMQATERAIEEYDLTNMTLQASSGPAMTSTLAKEIRDNNWVVVTGWQPHWKFARFDLKFLADPKKVYGAAEDIHTVARKGLEKDRPKVARLLRQFRMDAQQLGTLMGMIADGTEPIDAGRQWMKDNPEVVNQWLE